jgi:hypothetical protein
LQKCKMIARCRETPAVPALRSLTREDCVSEASLGYW